MKSNIKKLEILITEDNSKHLADAREVSKEYTNINFTFVSTLNAAESLVKKNKYNAVVTDVFFPIQEGEEPTSDSGLSLAKTIDAKGIPFVYNTSGNHHGEKYIEFLQMSRSIWNNYKFGTGKMVESYPENPDVEKDTKQWSAAINYVILLATSDGLKKCVREKVASLLSFAPYGDYGQLTEKMRNAIDESLPIEEGFKVRTQYYSKQPGSLLYLPIWTSDTIDSILTEKKMEWNERDIKFKWEEGKNKYISLRDTKDEDEKWFAETEAKHKKHYIKALKYIRSTITKYRKDMSNKNNYEGNKK